MSEDRKEKITAEDIRSALTQMGVYVDVTEDDLMKIYALALEHAKKEAGRKILVKDIMTREVITVDAGAAMPQMSALMYQHRISGLPVVDAGRRVIGIVTEADLIARVCIERGHAFKRTLRHLFGETVPVPRTPEDTDGTAKDLMNQKVITVHPDDEIGKAAAIMDEKRIKRLPVVHADGTLAGIISRADIVRTQISGGTGSATGRHE
ncbi:MAG: CBS domain-containing protein, partial [Nitrospiraceae bacterium]|nr:CBS domain-containing protein [Nitrospiraceae bacterium]